MADSENNKEGGVAVPAATTEETSSSSFTDSASKWMSSMTVPTTETTWKLPDGIEDHIESGPFSKNRVSVSFFIFICCDVFLLLLVCYLLD